MLEENTTLAGRYQIVRRLASGGMGAVYEARHVETGRVCAVKVMLAHVAENSPARERFRLEARAAALVSSAHVVEVLDAGVHEATGSPFLVMELLRGEDLASRMSRVGPLPAAEVAKFIFQAARGLDALHRAAIVHRDLKPSNLFLAKRDHTEIIKVLDLGVAKRVMDTAVTTAVVGTPLYMAPEQMANRKISPATDEYALAMVAYSLLVGREYWAAEAESATSSIGFALLALDGPKEAATERANKAGVQLPVAFDAWFRRGTEVDPEKRFPDVLDAALNLATALGVDASEWRAEVERAGQNNAEQAPKILASEAFAPTVASENAEKSALKTLTLSDEPVEARAQTLALAKTEQEPQIEIKRNRNRRLLVGGVLGILGLVGLSAYLLREKPKNEVVVVPPVIQALQCNGAEVTGPGASKHLADALAKGACARLGIEIGVPWLDPKGMPLEIQAETRADHSAHVVLQLAQQKAEGEGKTLIKATDEAIGKLVPLLKVAPMDPQRIADWGAKDAAGALRIERAMRKRALHFADPQTLAKELVATDPDSPMSHALLACAAKHSDSELAIRERKEAMARLAKLPPKRAQLVEANLMDFIPMPEDPKGRAGIVGTYAEMGKDPDFATLYTMCGCVLAGVTFPMADWLEKNAPVMGLPIMHCIAGSAETDREHTERHLAWIKATLPEWQRDHVATLVQLGQIEQAKEAQDLIEWLDSESKNSLELVTSKVTLAYGTFDSSKAVTIAEESYGEPDPATAGERTSNYVNSLIFAGKIRRALDIGEQRLNMFGQDENYYELGRFAAELMRLQRLLQLPAFSPKTLERISEVQAKLTLSEGDDLQAELALLRAATKKDKKALDTIDALLVSLETSDIGTDYRHAAALPLVRKRRSDAATAAMYREIGQRSAQQTSAFEAGLALEAIGAKTEAEKAYRLCLEEPWRFPFEAIAARMRLSEMAKADGRVEEAQELTKLVDRAWSDADPDLRDIVKRMK